MTVVVYTDGACKAARGRDRVEPTGMGGWAWWVDDHFWDSGAVNHTTNNRMEMLAVIQGLHAMKSHRPDERLLIVSDSAYVVNCFADGWYEAWFKNNWRNSAGKPVKNRDLWETLLDLYYDWPTSVSFRHIRGHGRGGPGDAPYVHGNDKADRLAVAARLTLEKNQEVREVGPDRLPDGQC